MAGRAIRLGTHTLMVPPAVFRAIGDHLEKERGRPPRLVTRAGEPNPLDDLRLHLAVLLPGWDVYDVAGQEGTWTLANEPPRLVIPRPPVGVKLICEWKKDSRGKSYPEYTDPSTGKRWVPSAEDWSALPAVWEP